MDKKHRIKELIKEKGYTQEEFAELLGMSRNGLYQILNGIPSGQSLVKIAEALNVELWELFEEGRTIASKYQDSHNEIRCPNCNAPLEASFTGSSLILTKTENR